MPRQRRRNRVLRERNERGLSFFLRSLRSMLRILVSKDLISINSEDLQQLVENLLDSSATLTLLIEDLSSSRTTITGLPVECLGRMSALKRDTSVVIDYISEHIHKDRTDSDQENYAYSAQNNVNNQNLGRPYLDVTREQLEHLRSIHFSWKQIADLLKVSYSTIKRRKREYGMDCRFSSITNGELDGIYARLISQEGLTLGTPNLGRRRFLGALRSHLQTDHSV